MDESNYNQPIYTQYIPVPKPENKFKPSMSDFVLALIMFVLGYLFARWVFFAWTGWGVAAFTTLFILSSTCYLIKKDAFVKSIAAWFWLAVTWLIGASYAIWDNAGFNVYRSLFLLCSAVYYVLIASGNTFTKGSSNFLLIDGINAAIILPFRNFINQYVSFSVLGKSSKRGRVLPILLGVAIALILLAILIPLLRSADSGGFTIITEYLADLLNLIDSRTLICTMLGIPVAAYLYGLLSAVAHKKGTDIIKRESVKKTVAAMRFFHMATIYIVLGAICIVFIVFILSQLPYFFSAFTGDRPDGWLVYSEYARRGFFELCGIAVINLFIITGCNVTSKKHRKEGVMLRVFNIALAAITLILIATAFSKMALYIDAYGLTMPRLLPCIFMVFMAVVFIALILLQKWDFSIVRVALITGAVLMCVMSFVNPDALVVRYNTDRYLSGSLRDYDTEVLYRAGNAGVLPALEVLYKTQDARVVKDVNDYLAWQKDHHASMYGSDSDRIGGGVNAYSFESYTAEMLLP